MSTIHFDQKTTLNPAQKDIWKYDLATLEHDLSAHLVFSTVTAY